MKQASDLAKRDRLMEWKHEKADIVSCSDPHRKIVARAARQPAHLLTRALPIRSPNREGVCAKLRDAREMRSERTGSTLISTT